jgi:uncharacterized protein RhaS with RHS repeats
LGCHPRGANEIVARRDDSGPHWGENLAPAASVIQASCSGGSNPFVRWTHDPVGSRLTETRPSGAATVYGYDGDGVRVQASAGGQTTSYLWDTTWGLPQLALERDGQGALIRRYTYGAARISLAGGGGLFYYHYDQLGSVANLTDAAGARQWTYAYEPYGATRSATPDDPGAPANPMQYTGEHHDPTGRPPGQRTNERCQARPLECAHGVQVRR